MAKILLVTASTAHAAYTNTKAALESKGHTVVGVLDSALTTPAADIDLIATVRATPANYGPWIATQWAAGIPILLGGPENGSAAGATTHATQALGILDSPITQSSADRNMLCVNDHEMFDNIAYTVGNDWTMMSSTNYGVVDLGTSYGTVVGTDGADEYMVAVEQGDTLTSGTAPARAVFMGWFYAGQSDYTPTGKDVVGAAVDWVVATPPEPVVDAQIDVATADISTQSYDPTVEVEVIIPVVNDTVDVATATASADIAHPTVEAYGANTISVTQQPNYDAEHRVGTGGLISSGANSIRIEGGTSGSRPMARYTFSKSAMFGSGPVVVSQATLSFSVVSRNTAPAFTISPAGQPSSVLSTYPEPNAGARLSIDVTEVVNNTVGDTITIDLVGSGGSSVNHLTIHTKESTTSGYRPTMTALYEPVPVVADVAVATSIVTATSHEAFVETQGSTEIILDTLTATAQAHDASVALGVSENVATASASVLAPEATIEAFISPDSTSDVQTAAITAQAPEADVQASAVVEVTSTDTVMVGAYDTDVETTIGIIVDLDTPRIDYTHIRLTDVNGEPVLASETEDPYFESTMRTLRGYRRGISGGTAGTSQGSALDESFAEWFRFNERSGTQAFDRAYLLTESGNKQAQDKMDLSNVVIGLNDGPDNRHHFYFNGDAYAAQVEPSDYDLYYKPASLEFTFRTTRRDQFIMGGADVQGGTLNVIYDAPWELWMVDGKLEMRQYGFRKADGSQTYEVTTGFRDLADGEWHHVVIQKSHEGSENDFAANYFEHETYVDARLEIRRRRGPLPLGFPDFIGGRPAAMYNNIRVPDLAKSHWFIGDMTEIVYRNGRTLTDDEIGVQRDNVMGIQSVRPDSAHVEFNASETITAKGNKPRVLILDFKPGTAGLLDRRTVFKGENQAAIVYDGMPFATNRMEVSLDFPGWGETETPNSPSRESGDYLWFRKEVTGYFDRLTDNHRLIDLDTDLNMDDYDIISIIGYPRNNAGWAIYDQIDAANAAPMVPMRKQMEGLMNQIREQVTFNRKGLYITDPASAIALGIVDKVDFVPTFKEEAYFDQRLGANVGGMDWHAFLTDPFNGMFPDRREGEIPDKREYSQANRERAARYLDMHANVKQRVRNVVQGLTTLPGWVKTDEISWWNVNPFASFPYAISRRFEDRSAGLYVGDEFYIDGGYHNPADIPNVWQLDRAFGFAAAPMSAIKAGVAVTTFGRVFFSTTDEDVDDAIGNPYQDHAVSIAIQPGDSWNGQQVSGKVYVNFTESDVWNPEIVKDDRIQKMTSHGYHESESIGLGDKIKFSDGGEWEVTTEHLRYNFSTQYGTFIGSEVNLPSTGGAGSDWGWSPGGTRTGTQTGGSGHAWVSRWKPFVPLVTIPTPTMSNRAVKWLATDLDIGGNANVSVSTAAASTESNEVEVEATQNTVVDLSTARVNVQSYSDADTIDPDVTVLTTTPAVVVATDALIEEVVLDTAQITTDVEALAFTADVDYSEALVMTLPRQILTLIMEDG